MTEGKLESRVEPSWHSFLRHELLSIVAKGGLSSELLSR